MIVNFNTTYAEDAYHTLYNLREQAKLVEDHGSVRAITYTMGTLREQLDPEYVEGFLRTKASPRTALHQDKLVAALSRVKHGVST